MRPQDVTKMTVKKLQEALGKYHLDKKGNKAELLERLTKHLESIQGNVDNDSKSIENSSHVSPDAETTASTSESIDTSIEVISTTIPHDKDAKATVINEEISTTVNVESITNEDISKDGDQNDETIDLKVVNNKVSTVKATQVEKRTGTDIEHSPNVMKKQKISTNVPTSDIEATKTIRIDNFIRPFTLNAVKDFVQQDGSFVEDGFWMDSIKTHCYVTFESVDVANQTRLRIHNMVWPELSGRQLTVQFSAQTASDIAKNQQPTALTGLRRGSRHIVDGVSKTAVKSIATATDTRPTRSVVPKPPINIHDIYFKTATEPILFYLPVSDELIQRRKEILAQEKLNKKDRNNKNRRC